MSIENSTLMLIIAIVGGIFALMGFLRMIHKGISAVVWGIIMLAGIGACGYGIGQYKGIDMRSWAIEHLVSKIEPETLVKALPTELKTALAEQICDLDGIKAAAKAQVKNGIEQLQKDDETQEQLKEKLKSWSIFQQNK